MVHQVKTEKFEGPLELLLDLIEKQKLSINEVSLATIANAYLTEVKSRATIAPGEVANFLVVAATLMLIKSRSLLPGLAITPEEEQSIEELENRLNKLRRMRELSRHIAELASQGNRMYERDSPYDLPALFYPPENVTTQTLHEGIQTLIRALPSLARELPKKTLARIISLEEKIKELLQRVETSLTKSFKTFVGHTAEKSEIIISFLALLELVKQGHVVVDQGTHFGDISIVQNVNIKMQNDNAK